MRGSNNKRLSRAIANKNDEFYTMFEEIEKELVHYKQHFKNKVVFCNCDDPKEAKNLRDGSHFWNYFYKNFEHLGLKKLITTHYLPPEKKKRTYKLEYTGKNMGGGVRLKKTMLKQNGDFRSDECVELLREADIVVTNPPFSKLRLYMAQLMEHKKKFLIIGNMNAVFYKEIFPLLQKNKIWMGVKKAYNMNMIIPKHLISEDFKFKINDNGDAIADIPMVMWFTNLTHKRRKEDILLYREYNEKDFPKYDNYDAIEVGLVKEIPKNYYGKIGVPKTFMSKHNPNQFEVLGRDTDMTKDGKGLKLNGKNVFARFIIQRKRKKK